MSGGRNFRDKLRNLGVVGQATLVSAVVGLGLLAAAPLAYEISGPRGPLAAAVAAAVCLAGAVAAVVAASLFRGPSAGLYSLAMGMLARTILPLFAGVVLTMNVAWLKSAGMIVYLLVFYLATLAVETALLVAQISDGAKS